MLQAGKNTNKNIVINSYSLLRQPFFLCGNYTFGKISVKYYLKGGQNVVDNICNSIDSMVSGHG